MPTNNIKPTAAELRILQQLWKVGPQSVRAVHAALAEEKPVVYTTVLKTMQLMHQSGLLERDSSGRAHIYTAAVERESIQDSLLDNFLHRTFSGSTMSLVMRALGNHKASKAELDELKAFIRKMEDE
ncbi:MAG: BlaI/MecI/CopY family transcriptional regulator [Bacteroidota bacterium]